jgi:thioredoxin
MPAVLDTSIRTDAQNLERALATRYPVVVAFEAPDAEPCAGLEPDLEEMAQSYVDRIRVIRVADANEGDLAARYGITHVPTLVFRRHGREVARVEGAASHKALEAHVRYLIGEGPRPERAVGPRVPLRRRAPASSDPPFEGEATPLTVTDATFDGFVLGALQPVLVDFWATWSNPCRTIAPVIDELARDHPGRVRVVKVDIDASPGVARRYGVSSIPTFILFREGRPVFRVTGAVSKASLGSVVDAALSLP